jgi:hypothetical protein
MSKDCRSCKEVARLEKELAETKMELAKLHETWLDEGVPLPKKGITMVATDGE